MSRTPIYPEVENFIILKKRAKLEKTKSDSTKESSTTQTPKRTSSSLEKVKDISGFIREVLFKAQLFVNFFILQHPPKLTNDFFDQNFWYTITRVIRGSSDEVRPILQAYKDKKKERPADQNLNVVLLTSSFVELSATMNSSLFVPDVGNNLTSFLNPLILEAKNRISTLPLFKESLSNKPFKILPALRHILEKYDDIYKAQATQKDKTDSMKFLLSRRFSIFSNPTLHWRFIKIDAQNLTGIFPDAKQKKQANESSFDHQQRCFYQMFAFKRLGIQRVLFARKALPSPPEDNICLELNDLSREEVNKHFRLCTVDPRRQDPFVSYHGGTDIRRLSSIEYYNIGGSVTRMKEQQKYKHRLGIEKIETDIPSPKTASMEQFVLYITYMSQHMNTLFDFYGFETFKVKWLNYLSSQKAIQESVNILINGGKKYNKGRRKKTKENRKRSKKTRRPRTTLEERVLTTIPKSKRSATAVSKAIWKFSKLDKMTMKKDPPSIEVHKLQYLLESRCDGKQEHVHHCTLH
ncbi:hypothetical protein MFLAVUS_004583 [Mucor flavus]|uniref:Uncharacterized protein n=1 Tax=Mucor flavus TaxID=439312 RepID=A0ABP9YWC1_9FUNG